MGIAPVHAVRRVRLFVPELRQAAAVGGKRDARVEPDLAMAARVRQRLPLMALTVVAFVGLLATSKSADDDNPFDGQTLEWATTSPAPTNNFLDAPTVMSAEPVTDMAPARSSQTSQTNQKGDA